MAVIGKNDAGLHRGVVGDDHEVASTDLANARHDPCCRRTTPFRVHLKRGIDAELQKLRLRIHELRNSLPCGQPAFLMLSLDGRAAATFRDLQFIPPQLFDELLHRCRSRAISRR